MISGIVFGRGRGKTRKKTAIRERIKIHFVRFLELFINVLVVPIDGV